MRDKMGLMAKVGKSIFDPPLGALEQLEMSSCLFKEHPTDLIYNVKGRVI